MEILLQANHLSFVVIWETILIRILKRQFLMYTKVFDWLKVVRRRFKLRSMIRVVKTACIRWGSSRLLRQTSSYYVLHRIRVPLWRILAGSTATKLRALVWIKLQWLFSWLRQMRICCKIKIQLAWILSKSSVSLWTTVLE